MLQESRPRAIPAVLTELGLLALSALLFALSGRQKGGDYTYLAIQDYVAISAES